MSTMINLRTDLVGGGAVEIVITPGELPEMILVGVPGRHHAVALTVAELRKIIGDLRRALPENAGVPGMGR